MHGQAWLNGEFYQTAFGFKTRQVIREAAESAGAGRRQTGISRTADGRGTGRGGTRCADGPDTPDPKKKELEKGDSVIKGDLKFVVLDLEKKIVSVEGSALAKGKKFAVNIPPAIEINGIWCKVAEVKKKGFEQFTKITKVTLGKNVTKVGKNAFSGCKVRLLAFILL